ncbi:MAG: hypothetical protein K0Q72_5467, partial [Armatimonadetes bacterium]|nr:hypothetical protein [Armatimonadota bacterium]
AAAEPTSVPSDHVWVIAVSALSVLLGIMLALTIQTTNRIRHLGLPSTRFGVSPATLSGLKEKNEDLQRDITKERELVNEFRLTQNSEQGAGKLLNQQLSIYKAFLGLAPVEGPGLEITLRSSPIPRLPGTDPSDYLANDEDVNGLISELWAAGAEAIAIAGLGAKPERFVVSTTVQRVGTGIMVNGRTMMPPYRIMVIGNPKELRASMRMPEGIVQARSLDTLKMIQIEESPRVVLPAFSGGRGSGNPAPAHQ